MVRQFQLIHTSMGVLLYGGTKWIIDNNVIEVVIVGMKRQAKAEGK
jgi:hypothetical protein